jgi:hypothetical protein
MARKIKQSRKKVIVQQRVIRAEKYRFILLKVMKANASNREAKLGT